MHNETPGILHTVWSYKWTFVVIICVMFFITFTGLFLIGFVPDEFAAAPDDSQILASDSTAPSVQSTQPGYTNSTSTVKAVTATAAAGSRITIPKVGDSSIIQFPTTTNVDALDQLLINGVVHYPGSGMPGKGNMFLFAHSTSIQIVHNQAYKAFNHLDSLVAGDEITIESEGRIYVYKVRDVTKQNEGVARVNLTDTRNMLTLTTCDTFSGIKQQRIIVEADFDHSYAA